MNDAVDGVRRVLMRGWTTGFDGAALVDCDVDDELWARLREKHSPEAVIELLMLAGYYRMISYLVRALRLPLETGARRFP